MAVDSMGSRVTSGCTRRRSVVVQAMAPLVFLGAADTAAADPGIGVYSIVGGVLSHDRGLFSNRTEEGIDVNAEIQFRAFDADYWSVIGSPRPHIGASINTAGDTSLGYAGLTWSWDVTDDIFLDGAFSLVVHDGELESDSPDRRDFGSRVLFRFGVEVGYRLAPRHALTVFADHASHGRLLDSDHNDGLETVGVRYHFLASAP